MKKEKNMLDEMQDSRLMKIGESGFWLVFWILFAAVALQALLGATLKELAGEIAALLAAGAYVAFSCLKNGLWTRKSAPSLKVNAIGSAVPSLFLGAFNAVRAFAVLKKPAGLPIILQIAAMSAGVYVLCFAVLEVFRHIYKKRRAELDGSEDQADREK